MKFVWDEHKRINNLKKHRLDFIDAEKVFAGSHIIFEDCRFDYGEQRLVAVGFLGVAIVVIVHVESSRQIRIISMRKATRNEQKMLFRL